MAENCWELFRICYRVGGRQLHSKSGVMGRTKGEAKGGLGDMARRKAMGLGQG